MMGHLDCGKWLDQDYSSASTGGQFVRKPTVFRNWVTSDGSAGPSGDTGFQAEPGRYHLYISHACPWAHRTVIFRKLKGLEDMIGLSVVHWYMAERGWTFDEGAGVVPDTVNGAKNFYEVYLAAQPEYSGRVTVPVLWDKHTKTIVSNESSEIIRMFNSAFDGIGASAGDFYPEPLRAEIDTINERIYDTVNNGVYRAGFATNQIAYEDAVGPMFDTLDWLEDRLNGQRYLTGSRITEADWRLFTTLIRFDPVYVGHFKCNLKRIADYANLSNYLRDLYQNPGIAETVNMSHIKQHYYQSHTSVNPTQIVPAGPVLDHQIPHDRSRFTQNNN